MKPANQVFPESTATILRVWGILSRNFPTLVMVYLIARLPTFLLMSALNAVRPWLIPFSISEQNSPVTFFAVAAPLALGSFVLAGYCDVWSYTAVSRLVFARLKGTPLTPRTALEHVSLIAVGKIYLRVLPLLVLALLLTVSKIFNHEYTEINFWYYYHSYFVPIQDRVIAAVAAMATGLLIILSVEATDEKDIESFGGKKFQAFMVVSMLSWVGEFGMTYLSSFLPREASPIFWLGINTLKQAYSVLLMPVVIVTAAVLYLKGEKENLALATGTEAPAQPQAEDQSRD